MVARVEQAYQALVAGAPKHWVALCALRNTRNGDIRSEMFGSRIEIGGLAYALSRRIAKDAADEANAVAGDSIRAGVEGKVLAEVSLDVFSAADAATPEGFEVLTIVRCQKSGLAMLMGRMEMGTAVAAMQRAAAHLAKLAAGGN